MSTMTKDQKIWHKAYLVHQELINMDWCQEDIMIFIECLKKIDNSLD